MSPRAILGCITLLLSMPIAYAQSVPSTRSSNALHQRLLTLDTHLDTPLVMARPGWNIMERHDAKADLSQVDYPRMVRGGLDGGFWVIYTPQGPRTPEATAQARDTALLTALRIREMVARHADRFELALTSADAQRIAAAGRRVVYMSIENSYPLGSDPTWLRTFHTLGVRLVGLVHSRNNDLADSSTGPTPEWQGVSALGKQFIAEANRLGMVLDASHASDQALEQMLELSKTPLLLSHSSCKDVYGHPRNVGDALLRKLAAQGGVIQMNSVAGFLVAAADNRERRQALDEVDQRFGPEEKLPPSKIRELAAARKAVEAQYPSARATFEDFMKHLLHALQLVGPQHVGLGADWDGGGGVEGMQDVADLPKITQRLLAAGYSEQDLAAIWSGNVLRVLRKAEEHAAQAAQPQAARLSRSLMR
jgi:membrane dipeptidase